MRLHVLRKGREIFEEEGVIFDPDASNSRKLMFKVKSESRSHPYSITYDQWNRLNCTCEFGSNAGVNGAICKHKHAVICWLERHKDKVEECFKQY
mgnify:CR=1 FL=1